MPLARISQDQRQVLRPQFIINVPNMFPWWYLPRLRRRVILPRATIQPRKAT